MPSASLGQDAALSLGMEQGVGDSMVYSTLKTWSLGPGQSPMALPVKIASCFGVLELGVLECWQKRKPEFQLE